MTNQPGTDTYLEYTIVPSPLSINEKQDIIILATLKTSVQNQGKLTSVTVDNIVLDFGSTGTAATDLTTATNAITLADFEKSQNWNFAPGGGTGTSFTVSPSSTSISKGTITSNTIMIKINGVAVNGTPGNATVTITETVSDVNGSPSQSENVNQTSLVLPKVQSKNSTISFTANPDNMQAGNKTVLSWNAPDYVGAVFELKYVLEDQLFKIQGHKNGVLKYDDQYPGASDPDLILDETTIFILSILSNGTTTTLTVPVIVSMADIYANQATIPNYQGGDFSFKDGDETLLNITGAGGSTTITINTDQGTNSWTKLIFQNQSNSWTIGTSQDYDSNELYFRNPNGSNVEISTEGNLDLNSGTLIADNANITDSLTVSNAAQFSNGPVSIAGESHAGALLTVRGSTIGKEGGGSVVYIGPSEGANGLTVAGICFNLTGTWFVFSDTNLKENVQPYSNGLSEVLKMNPITYRFKKEVGLNSDFDHIGLSAQELQEIAPEMVHKTKSALKKKRSI